MEWSAQLGDRLREVRREHFRSIVDVSREAQELAERLGMTVRGLGQGSLSEYERGVTVPNVDALRVLARLFGVSLLDLAPDLPEGDRSSEADG